MKVVAVATLLLGGLTSVALASDKFYPIPPPVPPGTMAPPQSQNSNVKRADLVTETAVNFKPTEVDPDKVREKFIIFPGEPAPYPNSLYTPPVAVRAAEPTIAPTAKVNEKFIIFPGAPAPYPISLYTPTLPPRAEPTDAPSNKCPHDDVSLEAMDTTTNVTYHICCPLQMAYGTAFKPDRSLQCCADKWRTACSNDPEDAVDCAVGFWRIADAISGRLVCKPADQPASLAPTSSLTTAIASPTSLVVSPTKHSQTATSTAPSSTSASSTQPAPHAPSTGAAMRIRTAEVWNLGHESHVIGLAASMWWLALMYV